MSVLPLASAGLISSLGAFHAVAALLACADPVKWASLGRPAARDLGALLHQITGELECELGEVVQLPGAEGP